MDKEKLDELMKEMRKSLPRELLENPEKYIPEGIDCLHMPGKEIMDKIFSEKWLKVPIFEIRNHKDFEKDFSGIFQPCPFWVQIEERMACCLYLMISDYDTGTAPLWDQVKACDVKYRYLSGE